MKPAHALVKYEQLVLYGSISHERITMTLKWLSQRNGKEETFGS